MHVLVVGAAGMLGDKFVASLSKEDAVPGRTVDRLTLVDVREPVPPAGFRGTCECWAADFSAPGEAQRMIESRPDLIVHLAAIVSGEAEVDFDKGYRVNLDGTRALFEAIRAQNAEAPYKPRVIFTSSIAVFGAPFPAEIDETFFTTPLTSYGAQKAICELLLADYSRRGIFDGLGIRLPTICIRPGRPNRAASGFFSSIVREPLIGEEAVLPVGDDVRGWHTSPRSAVRFLLHAATLDLDSLGPRRILNMPGLSASVGDQIAALGRIGGKKAVSLIRREPNPAVERIVTGWAAKLDDRRARTLGFTTEDTFDEIIRAHIEDELGGAI